MTVRRVPANRLLPLLLAGVTLLSLPVPGCGTSPRQDGDDALTIVPPDWPGRESAPTGSEGATPGVWWDHFSDPDLAALIDEALTRNPDVRIVAARVAAASAALDGAGALRWPELGFTLEAGRQRQNFIGIDIPGSSDLLSSTTTRFGASLSARWEVDLWGRLAAGEETAREFFLSALAEEEAVRLSLSAQVAIAWFALIEAGRQHDLAVDIRDRFRSNEQRIAARAREGVRGPLDLRLARTERAAADATVAAAGRTQSYARRALELLLGRYPATEIAGRGDLPLLAAEVPVGIPATVLSRRPDLIAARARLRASAADRDRAEAEVWPQLVLTGSGGTLSKEFSDLLDGDFGVWSLAAGLVGTIFDHGRRRAQVDAAEGRRLEAEAIFARAVLLACGEVEGALRDEELLAIEAARLAELLAESRGARDLAGREYAVGLGDILTLLSAERSTAKAASRVLAVARARLENRVRLLVALGGATALPEAVSPGDPEVSEAQGAPE